MPTFLACPKSFLAFISWHSRSLYRVPIATEPSPSKCSNVVLPNLVSRICTMRMASGNGIPSGERRLLLVSPSVTGVPSTVDQRVGSPDASSTTDLYNASLGRNLRQRTRTMLCLGCPCLGLSHTTCTSGLPGGTPVMCTIHSVVRRSTKRGMKLVGRACVDCSAGIHGSSGQG